MSISIKKLKEIQQNNAASPKDCVNSLAFNGVWGYIRDRNEAYQTYTVDGLLYDLDCMRKATKNELLAFKITATMLATVKDMEKAQASKSSGDVNLGWTTVEVQQQAKAQKS